MTFIDLTHIFLGTGIVLDLRIQCQEKMGPLLSLHMQRKKCVIAKWYI